MDQINAFLETVVLELGAYQLRVLNLIGFVTVLLGTIWVRWLVDRALRRSTWFRKLSLEDDRRKGIRRLLRRVILGLGALLAVTTLGFELGALLERRLFSLPEKNEVKVINVVTAVVIVVAARLGVWYFHRLFVESGAKTRIALDQGRRQAVYQIFKYIVYVVAIFLILNSLHINLNWLIASSAALFVGVGLALQHVFDDLVSGIIILFEGTMEVGDMVYIHSLKLEGKVMEIRLRTTIVESLDSVSVIVPNSKITSTDVVNWNFNDRETRFHVGVGVAYGSDLDKVRRALIRAANSHGLVLKTPEPRVRFTEFGDSSLNFELLFWTNHTYAYEDIKSDLRFKIEAEFRRADIRIPFPQRDLHLRSDFRSEAPAAEASSAEDGGLT
ncbi:MAG: hypothetical protein D6722_13035 [Bacteroidetes bacterium]|nr:MAG: hypothetical protein D6722_13035 [Bacteroidota bacterium]